LRLSDEWKCDLCDGLLRQWIVTLRDERGAIRVDVDRQLQLMAQAHCKCFLAALQLRRNMSALDHP
jgi:hypothetical protein